MPKTEFATFDECVEPIRRNWRGPRDDETIEDYKAAFEDHLLQYQAAHADLRDAWEVRQGARELLHSYRGHAIASGTTDAYVVKLLGEILGEDDD